MQISLSAEAPRSQDFHIPPRICISTRHHVAEPAGSAPAFGAAGSGKLRPRPQRDTPGPSPMHPQPWGPTRGGFVAVSCRNVADFWRFPVHFVGFGGFIRVSVCVEETYTYTHPREMEGIYLSHHYRDHINIYVLYRIFHGIREHLTLEGTIRSIEAKSLLGFVCLYL